MSGSSQPTRESGFSRQRPGGSLRYVNDPGQVRAQNEDACFTDAEQGLLIVSHGMRGT